MSLAQVSQLFTLVQLCAEMAANDVEELESEVENLRRGGAGTGNVHDSLLLEDRVQEVEQRNAALEDELQTLQQELERQRASYTELTGDLNLERDRTSKREQEITSLRADLSTVKSRVRDYPDLIANKDREIENLGRIIDQKTREQSRRLTEVERLSQVNAILVQDKTVLGDKLNELTESLGDRVDAIEQANAAFAEADRHREEAVRQKQVLEHQVVELEQRLAEVSVEGIRVHSEVRSQVQAHEHVKNVQATEISSKDAQIVALSKRLSELELELRSDRSLDRYERELAERNARIARLTDQMDDCHEKLAILAEEFEAEQQSYHGRLAAALAEKERDMAVKLDGAEAAVARVRALEEASTKDRALLVEKEKENVELLRNLREFEQGVRGMPEAVAEIRQLRSQIEIRDQDIEQKATLLTHREKQVGDLFDENQAMKRRFGIPRSEGIQVEDLQLGRQVEQQQLKALCRQLREEVRTLEQERVHFKAKLRHVALLRGERATSLGMNADQLKLLEMFGDRLRDGMFEEYVAEFAADSDDLVTTREAFLPFAASQVAEEMRNEGLLKTGYQPVSSPSTTNEGNLRRALAQVKLENRELRGALASQAQDERNLLDRRINGDLRVSTDDSVRKEDLGHVDRLIELLQRNLDTGFIPPASARAGRKREIIEGDGDASRLINELEQRDIELEQQAETIRRTGAELSVLRSELQAVRKRVADAEGRAAIASGEVKVLANERDQLRSALRRYKILHVTANFGEGGEGDLGSFVGGDIMEVHAQLVEALEIVVRQEEQLRAMERDMTRYRSAFTSFHDTRGLLYRSYINEKNGWERSRARLEQSLEQASTRAIGLEARVEELQRLNEALQADFGPRPVNETEVQAQERDDRQRARLSELANRCAATAVKERELARKLAIVSKGKKVVEDEAKTLRCDIDLIRVVVQEYISFLERTDREASALIEDLFERLDQTVSVDVYNMLSREFSTLGALYRQVTSRAEEQMHTRGELLEVRVALRSLEKEHSDVKFAHQALTLKATGMQEALEAQAVYDAVDGEHGARRALETIRREMASLRSRQVNVESTNAQLAAKATHLRKVADQYANKAEEDSAMIEDLRSRLVQLSSSFHERGVTEAELREELEHVRAGKDSELRTELARLQGDVRRLEHEARRATDRGDAAQHNLEVVKVSLKAEQESRRDLERSIDLLGASSERQVVVTTLHIENQGLKKMVVEARKALSVTKRYAVSQQNAIQRLGIELSQRGSHVSRLRSELISAREDAKCSVESVRRQFSGSTPLDTAVRYHESLHRIERRRRELEVSVGEFLETVGVLQDRLEEANCDKESGVRVVSVLEQRLEAFHAADAKVDAAIARDKVATLSDIAAFNKWADKFKTEKVARQRAERAAKHMKEQLAMAVKARDEIEGSCKRMEDELANASLETDRVSAEMRSRLAVMSKELEGREATVASMIGVLKQKSDEATSYPDPELPVSDQLTDALARIEQSGTLVRERDERIQQLTNRIDELVRTATEHDRIVLVKDQEINDLHRNLIAAGEEDGAGVKVTGKPSADYEKLAQQLSFAHAEISRLKDEDKARSDELERYRTIVMARSKELRAQKDQDMSSLERVAAQVRDGFGDDIVQMKQVLSDTKRRQDMVDRGEVVIEDYLDVQAGKGAAKAETKADPGPVGGVRKPVVVRDESATGGDSVVVVRTRAGRTGMTVEQLEQALDEKDDVIDKLNTRVTKLETVNATRKKQLARQQGELNRQRERSELDRERAEIVVNSTPELEKKLRLQRRNLSEKNKEIEKLRAAIEQLRDDYSKFVRMYGTKGAAVEVSTAAGEDQKRLVAEQQVRLSELQDRLELMRVNLNGMKVKLKDSKDQKKESDDVGKGLRRLNGELQKKVTMLEEDLRKVRAQKRAPYAVAIEKASHAPDTRRKQRGGSGKSLASKAGKRSAMAARSAKQQQLSARSDTVASTSGGDVGSEATTPRSHVGCGSESQSGALSESECTSVSPATDVMTAATSATSATSADEDTILGAVAKDLVDFESGDDSNDGEGGRDKKVTMVPEVQFSLAEKQRMTRAIDAARKRAATAEKERDDVNVRVEKLRSDLAQASRKNLEQTRILKRQGTIIEQKHKKTEEELEKLKVAHATLRRAVDRGGTGGGGGARGSGSKATHVAKGTEGTPPLMSVMHVHALQGTIAGLEKELQAMQKKYAIEAEVKIEKLRHQSSSLRTLADTHRRRAHAFRSHLTPSELKRANHALEAQGIPIPEQKRPGMTDGEEDEFWVASLQLELAADLNLGGNASGRGRRPDRQLDAEARNHLWLEDKLLHEQQLRQAVERQLIDSEAKRRDLVHDASDQGTARELEYSRRRVQECGVVLEMVASHVPELRSAMSGAAAKAAAAITQSNASVEAGDGQVAHDELGIDMVGLSTAMRKSDRARGAQRAAQRQPGARGRGSAGSKRITELEKTVESCTRTIASLQKDNANLKKMSVSNRRYVELVKQNKKLKSQLEELRETTVSHAEPASRGHGFGSTRRGQGAGSSAGDEDRVLDMSVTNLLTAYEEGRATVDHSVMTVRELHAKCRTLRSQLDRVIEENGQLLAVASKERGKRDGEDDEHDKIDSRPNVSASSDKEPSEDVAEMLSNAATLAESGSAVELQGAILRMSRAYVDLRSKYTRALERAQSSKEKAAKFAELSNQLRVELQAAKALIDPELLRVARKERDALIQASMDDERALNEARDSLKQSENRVKELEDEVAGAKEKLLTALGTREESRLLSGSREEVCARCAFSMLRKERCRKKLTC